MCSNQAVRHFVIRRTGIAALATLSSLLLPAFVNADPLSLAPPLDPPVAPAPTQSQPADDLTHLSLEDLMNVEVTSVSKEKESIADAPAAVTVIDLSQGLVPPNVCNAGVLTSSSLRAVVNPTE